MKRFGSDDSLNQAPGSGSSRPLGVTLLALGVLTITGLNWARLILTISNWQFLDELPGVFPLYVALTGLLWGVVGVPLTWSLWRGLKWAPRLMRAVMLTYAAYHWLDRIFLAEPMALSGQDSLIVLPINWPFTITITALLMVVIVWVLSRSDTKVFFGE